MPIKGVVLLIIFVGSIPVCFLRPFYGICLWMIVAFMNPQSYVSYWAVASSFPWAVVVGIPTMLGCLFFCRGWISRLVSREFFLLLMLWAWFTVTTVASVNNPMFMHHSADTLYRWQFVSKILLMTVFTMGVVDNFPRLRILMITVAGCFGLYAAKSLPFVILTGGAYKLYGPPESMVADNNDFGLAMNMTLPICFFLAQSEDSRLMKWLFGILSLMVVPAVLFTYSRGALVGLIAVLAVMFLGVRQRLAVMTAAIVAVVMVIALAPDSWKYRMNPLREGAVVDGSARSRLNSWGVARRLAADSPIVGGGFATFTPQMYALYADNKSDDTHGAHSVYFQVLGEHGYVGLGLYLSLVLSCFLTTHRLVRQGRRTQDRTLIHYANMFRYSMVAFLTSGAFLGRAYFDYFFLFVACVVVLKKVAADDEARSMDEGDEDVEEEGGASNVTGIAAELEVS